MDTTKVGIAAAKAMEEIEKFEKRGWIDDDSYVGAAYLVVAIDKNIPEEEADERGLRNPTTQCFVFGIPEEIYVQEGVLRMALNNYAFPNMESDDDD